MAFITPTNVATGDVLTATRYNADTVANMTEMAPFFGTWTSWTPTLSGGFSNGNATTVGRYLKVGKMVFYWGAITFGTTTVKGAIMKLSVPVPATSAIAACALTSIFGSPDGTQTLFTPLQDTVSIFEAVTLTSSGAYTGSAQTTATVPYTWRTADVVRYGGTYEAASA